MSKTESHQLNEELFERLTEEFKLKYGRDLSVDQLKTIIRIQQKSMADCVKKQKSFWVPNVVRLMFSEIKADKLGVEILNKPFKPLEIAGFVFSSELLTDKTRRRNVLRL